MADKSTRALAALMELIGGSTFDDASGRAHRNSVISYKRYLETVGFQYGPEIWTNAPLTLNESELADRYYSKAMEGVRMNLPKFH